MHCGRGGVRVLGEGLRVFAMTTGTRRAV
jgi:hypothetical protein